MKAHTLKTLLTLCSCFLASASWAQDWYEIEILIFEHRSNQYENLSDPESWPSDLDLEWPRPLLELDPVTDEQAEIAESDGEFLVPDAFIELPTDQERLSNADYAMRVRGEYSLLWHKAWKAPLLPEESSPWILIEAGEQIGDHYRLEGALRVHLSRYLHLHSNLWLTELLPAESDEQTEFHWSQLPAPATTQWPCIFIEDYWPDESRELPDDYFEKPAPDDWYHPFGCAAKQAGDSEEERLDVPEWLPMQPTFSESALNAPGSEEESESVSETESAPRDTRDTRDTKSFAAIFGSGKTTPVFTTGNEEDPASGAPIGFSRPSESDAEQTGEETLSQTESAFPVKEIIHIQSERRMRSEELHYIDHPRIGILAIIHPVEQPILEAEPIEYISAPLPTVNSTDPSTRVTE